MTTQLLSTYAPLHADALLRGEASTCGGTSLEMLRPVCRGDWFDGGNLRPVIRKHNIFYIVGNFTRPPSEGRSASFSKRVERHRSDLERLTDGWCGAGSLAPSAPVLSDLDALLSALPEDTAVPEIEVDEDSGKVTLRWQPEQAARALSFVINGSGNILAIMTTLGDEPLVSSRVFNVKAIDAVTRFADSEPELAEVLVHE